mgnify:CR=1 FL=1
MVFTGNTDVAAALARWAGEKNARTFYDVLRRCARGELLYDVTGSDMTVSDGTLAAGSSIGLRTHAMEDGSQYLLVFTSDAEIARTHPRGTRTSSLVQPALDAVRFGSTAAFAGVILDAAAGPASCIVTAEEIRRGLPAADGTAVVLKDTLAGPSLPGRRTQTLDALAAAPVLYIPVQRISADGSPAPSGSPARSCGCWPERPSPSSSGIRWTSTGATRAFSAASTGGA